MVGPEVLDEGFGDLEHPARRLAEDDGEQPLLLGEALACAQEEGYAGPAPVLDADAGGDESLGLGVGTDGRLFAVAVVLAADTSPG